MNNLKFGNKAKMVLETIIERTKQYADQSLIEHILFFINQNSIKSENTIITYIQDIHTIIKHFSETNSNQKIDQIPDDIYKWRDFIEQRREYISPRTQIKLLSSIKAFIKTLLSHEEYAKQYQSLNITLKKIKKPKLPKKHFKALTHDEVDIILGKEMKSEAATQTWMEKQDVALWTYLYGCGLRISEALQLKIQDLDSNTILIQGKRNKVREIPFPDFVRTILKDFLKYRPQTNDDHQYVFIDTKLNPISRNNVAIRLQKIRKKYSLDDKITPHALRHTFVTHLIEENACLRAIQLLVGHSSLSTLEHYSNVSIKHLSKAYENANNKNNPDNAQEHIYQEDKDKK